MARYLATLELGLGYGHLASLIPVAKALRALGHSVTLACHDPALGALARGAFDEIVTAPTFKPSPANADTLTYAQVIADAGYVDEAALVPLVSAWLQLFRQVRPDRLLVEHAPVSLLAAHVAGIRAFRLGPTFTAPSPDQSRRSLQPWASHSPAVIAASLQRADALVRHICGHFRASPLNDLAHLLAGAPNFALTLPQADHYGPQPAMRYFGPLGGVAGTGRPAWPRGGGPRLLVYLRFDRPAAGAVARVLASLGWPSLWHAPMPPNIPLADTIVWSAEPLDLAALAGEADLFIGRGGHGASAAMLLAGLPQLLFPDSLESVLLAYRLKRAGLATVCSSNLTPRELQEKFLSSLNINVQEIELKRDDIKDYGDAMLSNDLVDALIS